MALDTARAVTSLRDLTAKFDNSVVAATPFYPQLCTIIPSQGADEKYGLLGALPGVREWVGDRVFNELRAATFTIENKEYENSLLVRKNDIDDDRLGMYGPLLEQLGVEAAYHPDELLITVLEAAESTACFDAQYMIDTDHAWGASGTQSNDLTYNATTHTAVTAAEFKAAFNQALRAMLAFKRDNGKLWHRPIITENDLANLLLLVPLDLWEPAKEAMESVLIGGGNTNVLLRRGRVIPIPGLASGVKWWLANTNGPLRPFVFQARRPLARQMKGMDDREYKDVKFMTDARYNLGYGAWWNLVQTEFN